MTTQKYRARRSAASRAARSQKAIRAEQIVTAAFAEFSAHGFAGTRMEDVARRAGVAKGTIFLHFQSKQELFVAVVRSLVHPVFGQFAAFAEAFPGSAEELLRQMITRVYAEMVRNEKAGGILRMLVAEGKNFPELADIWRGEVIEPGMAAFRQVLRKGAAAGEFRESRAEQFPQIFVGPAILAILWGHLFGKRAPLDLDAYMAAHLDFVLGSLIRRDTGTQPVDLPGSGQGETS